MLYAEIAVNSPISRGSASYHYRLPPDLEVQVGQLLWVPFGPRRLQGVVLSLLESTDVEGVRDVLGLVDPKPVLSPTQIQLARWIVEHYRCSLSEAVMLMVPTGVHQRCFSTIQLKTDVPVPADLPARQVDLLSFLQRTGKIRVNKAKAALRLRGFDVVLGQLARRGLVTRGWETEKPRVRPQLEKRVRLAPHLADLDSALASVKSAPRQAEALRYLFEKDVAEGKESPRSRAWVPVAELYAAASSNAQVMKVLLAKGLVEIEEREVWRDPLADRTFPFAARVALTPDQQDVWRAIERDLAAPAGWTCLLHGVTGSGKTEIYLRALEETLKSGRQAIVMVPEIALTPQTVHRFASRFPERVAVLHSRLSLGERYDEWRRIRDGTLSIVIGSRSAIFAPVSNLGVIMVDEEHEWSYKHEKSPRYNARDVAIKLGELTGAKVILGSATPDVVTYYRAKSGRYRLLELQERVESPAPQGAAEVVTDAAIAETATARTTFMPPVHVVDLRQELRAGNRGIFSRALTEAIGLALSLHEQVILFLNRRGASTFVMCRDCGHVLQCKRCNIPLVYHSAEDDLVCHQCNYRTFMPNGCPNCYGVRIKFFGVGTQKVEEEVKKLFPSARVLRWDRDTTKGKMVHEQILQQFKSHEADVLIGTQMIAKGLDLPLVTLVGVISADTILNLPDFRAGERTFQLLTQVAGRAGRGTLGGRVIVQTYSPEHYCVQAASRHDYSGFYRQEIEFRREQGYPPFGRLVKLVHSYSNDDRAEREADRFAQVLRQRIDRLGLPGIDVIGPAPSYVRRLRGRFRWQLLIRGDLVDELFDDLPIPLGWSVDVDPQTTL